MPLTPEDFDEQDERDAHRATAAILQWAIPLVREIKPFEAQHNKGIFAASVMLYTGWLAKEMKVFAPMADCKNKCSYCCYQMVQVSPFEAFKIATLLKEEVFNRVQLAGERLARYNTNENMEQRFRDTIPCVFLRERQCTIYAVRPTACASYFSLDVGKCKRAWEARFQEDIPGADFIKPAQNIGISGQIAMDFAYWKEGKQTGHWELSYAVATAMKPGALDSWLSGFDVFDPARQFVYQQGGHEGHYSRLMEIMDRNIELHEGDQ